MMSLAELLPSVAHASAVIALKIVLLILFAALGFGCAVAIGLRARHPQPDPSYDPYARPFGDVVAKPDGGRIIPSDASAGRLHARGGRDV